MSAPRRTILAGMEAPDAEDRDVGEVHRLRGFLRAAFAAGTIATSLYAIAWAIYQQARFGELLALAVVFCAASAVAYRAAGRGDESFATTLWSGMTSAIIIVAAVLVPFMFPALMMMALVVTCFAVSFTSRLRLWFLLGVSLVAMSVIAAIGLAPSHESQVHQAAARFLDLTTIPLVAGLIVFVLAQFAQSLRAYNAALERRADERARALIRTEARLSSLIEAATYAIVTVERDGTIVEFNPAAEAMFGRTRAEVTGRNAAVELLPERSRDALARVLGVYQAGGAGPAFRGAVESFGRRAGGGEFPMEVTVIPVGRGPAGTDPLFTAFVQDISTRKAAEAALEESQRRFRQLLEHMPVGVYVIDTANRVTFVNDVARSLLGLPADLAAGSPQPRDGIPLAYLAGSDEPYPQEANPIDRALRGEDNVRVDDMEIHHPEATIPLEIVANPIFDGGRNVVSAIAVLVDMTEHRAVEATLRQSAAELDAARRVADAANRAKSQFLSRMSHELRTPLTAILGFGQLLEIENLTPGQHEYIGYVVKAGRHLLALINEVLDLAQVESGKLSVSLEPVALGDVIGETTDLLRPLAGQRSIWLSAEPPPTGWPGVLADQQRLKQVLLNLASNAIKYNRPEGIVRIGAAPASGSDAGSGNVRITVTDSGPGIPPADLKRLFTPFDRIGAELTETEGTGLGLSLSKVLVEAMGGTVGVDSTVGQGSTFWFELPPATAGEPAAVPQAPELPAPALSGNGTALPPASGECAAHTVLYIEDNSSNLRLIERLLQRRPAIGLVSAPRGQRGVELAREIHPDLILLDLHLPDGSGEQVLAALRADPSTSAIPVVIVSADALPGRAERLMAAGAHDYLMKPLDLPRLLDLVDTYTAGQP